MVVGTMIDQPPRITLASEATIELDGEQLRTTVDWSISSLLDLEGRLPIRIPESAPLITSETRPVPTTTTPWMTMPSSFLLGSDADRFVGESVSLEPWVVTVDDVPAALRELDGDRYELISDRLTQGFHVDPMATRTDQAVGDRRWLDRIGFIAATEHC